MTQNQIAESIARALGSPSRFVQKPFESSTLAASTADYYAGLSDKALNQVRENVKASKHARAAAETEYCRRHA